MKRTTLNTKCRCGGELSGRIGKPTQMEARIARLTCPSCHSRYMAKAMLLPGRKVKIDFEVLELKRAE